MDARLLYRHVIRAALLVFLATAAAAQANNYIVGPQDILQISVLEQPSLGNKFAVDADGTFTFPYIGRVRVGGLTVRAVEELLRKELANGYFVNPQVTVAVETYRSKRVFILGQVRNPATYALTGQMTLIEALATAGSISADAGSEVLILRRKQGAAGSGPLLPSADGQNTDADEIIRVDLKDLQAGKLSQNVELRDNDTIVVPLAELIDVTGEVKSPGPYPIRKGMTVRQALSAAGGITERGSDRRIKATRTRDGKPTQIDLKLDDLVQPGDTIVVGQRLF